MKRADTDDEPVSLAIAPDKVCFIVIKARAFDVKDAPTVSDPGSNPTDDDEIGILEDRPDDPVLAELTGFIDVLNEDEQVDLVALTWLVVAISALKTGKARAPMPPQPTTAAPPPTCLGYPFSATTSRRASPRSAIPARTTKADRR